MIPKIHGTGVVGPFHLISTLIFGSTDARPRILQSSRGSVDCNLSFRLQFCPAKQELNLSMSTATWRSFRTPKVQHGSTMFPSKHLGNFGGCHGNFFFGRWHGGSPKWFKPRRRPMRKLASTGLGHRQTLAQAKMVGGGTPL